MENIGDEIEFALGNNFVLFKGRLYAEGLSEMLKQVAKFYTEQKLD
jgi:hypothetical protein